jgi:PleD family two-component response regulator
MKQTMPAPAISYPRPPLALILTDQEWVSLSMVTLFAPRGYAVLRAFSGQQAVQRMREAPVDLLMIDRDLKDMSAIDLCGSMRQQNAATPLLMLSTSPWNRDEKLAALRAGAWEVCSLPMDSEELFVRVDTWVRSKLSGDVAREQGLLDPETGLYNAQGLLRRIGELGAGALRHRRPIACLVLAADPGPAAPASPSQTWTAATAATLAATLREAGRASDTIGRLSPTEFVVVAPDTDSTGVLGLAGRLHARVRSAFAHNDAGRVRVGCYAVPDFREASIAPTELLIRAAEASRSADADAEPIHFFESDFTPTR